MKRRVYTQAGQTYRAKAKHGHRYVRIIKVRRSGGELFAWCREVSRAGAEIKGRDRRGLRAIDFPVLLVRGRMPSWYECCEVMS